MRRILSLMCEYRKERLAASGATPEKLSEVAAMFNELDANLSGFSTGHGSQEQLTEVMTSADFTYALGDFVQRRMLPGYQTKTFDFEQFIYSDTSPNFMAVTRKQKRGGIEDLEFVGEKGEARPSDVLDATNKQWQPYVWEKQLEFSNRALINDDLGYFDDTARNMGLAARRSVEKYVSRMLWNVVTVARLVGLGALYSTTGRLTTARISTARMAFNQRTDARAEPIAAALRFLIYHAGLADTVAQIQNSTLVPELATNAVNVVKGTFTPVEDPYAAGVAPNLPWYALTDWKANGIIPFVLVRRAGVPGPWIGRKKSDLEFVASLLGAGTEAAPILGDFATGNIMVKVHDEYGTYIDNTEGNLVDFRGAYYSSGTAP